METNLALKYEERRDWKQETINGKPVLMAPGTEIHCTVSGNIYFLFQQYLRGKPCRAYIEGPKVRLTDRDAVFPDVMILCDRSKIQGGEIRGGPDLTVEVLSPATARRDRGEKMELYARAGVREYWIVDTKARSVEQYLLSDGTMKLRDVYTLCPEWELDQMEPEERAKAEAPFYCTLFPEFPISLQDIFYDLVEE